MKLIAGIWLAALITIAIAIVPTSAPNRVSAAKPLPEPLIITEQFRDVLLDGCIGEDDKLSWKLSGTLGPGESATFALGETLVPKEERGIPICDRSGRGLAAFISWAKRGGRWAGPVSQTVTWGDNTFEGVAICQKVARLDGDQFLTLTLTNEGSRRVHKIDGWGEIVNRSSLQFVAGCP